MLALHLAHGRLQLRPHHPAPVPQAEELLVRLHMAGICTTDLEMVRGYVPDFVGVLGHEFVGTAEAPHWAEWHGRRVVGSINIGCGRCPTCLAGVPEHCPTRTVLGIHGRDGVMAETFAIPLANLHPVPDSVSDEAAVFTEPLAAALRIREQIAVQPSARVAVIGPGRLGMLVGKVLALAGTEVTMLGRSAASLALPAQWGLATGLAEETADNEFDMVVEVTGNPAGLAQAVRITRPLGRIILKSTFAGSAPLNWSPIVVKELQMVGSRCGPFAPALRLLAQGVIPVADLIEQVYPLAEGLAAFAHAAQPGVRKVLLANATGD